MKKDKLMITFKVIPPCNDIPAVGQHNNNTTALSALQFIENIGQCLSPPRPIITTEPSKL